MSQLVQFGTNRLNNYLQDAIAKAEGFLALDRSSRNGHIWIRNCRSQRNVCKFLSSKLAVKSLIFDIQLATIAAEAYIECNDQSVNSFIFPNAVEAKSIKTHADGLGNLIEDCPWLPIEAKTLGFNQGLESLRKVYPCKRIKGENNKGDPVRRAFILRLAEKFYRSFEDIPVSVITELTSFGWQDISDRAVRSVLDAEKKGEIAIQVKAKIEKESVGDKISKDVMNRLNRRSSFEIEKSAPNLISDGERFRRAICNFQQTVNPDVGKEVIFALCNLAFEFGVEINIPIEESESEKTKTEAILAISKISLPAARD